MDLDTITTELQNLRFNKSNGRRQGLGRSVAERVEKPRYYFISGKIRNYKGVPPDNKKVIQTSCASYYPKNQRVIEMAKGLMLHHDPNFKYTSIQFAKNMKTDKHKDKNNVGESYIIALGDFRGGDLRIYQDEENYVDMKIHNQFLKFNGNEWEHETGEWSGGDRYTLTYFTIKPYD